MVQPKEVGPPTRGMPGTRRIRPRGEQRLSRLTTTAAEMFLESGYDTMSLDVLIERVGGSRRNIYSHFGGKEGLFLATVVSMCEEVAAPLRSLAIPRTGDPAAALQLFGTKLLAAVLLPGTLALHRLMISEAPRFPQLAQTTWQAGHAQAATILTDWVTHQQAAGVLRAGRDARRVAQHFVDLVVADVQLRALIGSGPAADAAAIDQIVAEATDTFLRGYAATQ
jgi:AcrR family transcriptional regulator